MKTILLTIAFGALALSAGALTVGESVRLDIEKGSHHPVLAPDGKTLLFSTVNHEGLKAYDMATAAITVIDDSRGAGFDPVFSADGSEVYYRTAVTVDGLLNRDVRSFSLRSGKARKLRKADRSDVNLAGLAGSDFVCADYRTITVSCKGKESHISPLADAHSYLWASMSPDGSRMIFTEPFKGVFVSGLDGSDARRVATKGDFSAWAGNDWIITVVSHDDGYVITDARLYAVNVNDGTMVSLTDEDTLVSEATAASDGTVIYTDIAGDMYMIKLNTAD